MHSLTLPPLTIPKDSRHLQLLCCALCTLAPFSALRCTHPPPTLSCAAGGRTWRWSSHKLPPPQHPSPRLPPPRRVVCCSSSPLRRISSHQSQILSRHRRISSSPPSPPLFRVFCRRHRLLTPDFKARKRLILPVRSTTYVTP
jgi:hypothetical protein